eukprot:m.10106 g.10106  ORF g.10106 m.10106 type:complete len:262 (+) comp4201_c0_seq1:112-897(+)
MNRCRNIYFVCFLLSSTTGGCANSDRIHVFQSGTELFFNGYEKHIESIRHMASTINATYLLHTFRGDTGCMFLEKVEAIHNQLQRTELGGWLIYIDLDVQYNHKSCSKWLELVPEDDQCHFVGLLSPWHLNSGVLLIRVTKEARELVKQWYDVQNKSLFCKGPADQLALQNVILRYQFPDYQEECIFENKEDFTHMDKCFMEKLNPIFHNNHKEEVRHNPYCLLRCGSKLQTRDCPRDMIEGVAPYFRHEKKYNLSIPLCS